MKNWNDIVLEEANKIMFYKNPRGSTQLYKAFTSQQTDKLIEKLEDYRESIISKFLEELEIDGDTYVIGVRFNNIAFGLYGKDGIARIATGESYSSSKVLNEFLNIDEFIKAL